jgi:hypothetical protein
MNDLSVGFYPKGRPLKMESAEIAKGKKQYD